MSGTPRSRLYGYADHGVPQNIAPSRQSQLADVEGFASSPKFGVQIAFSGWKQADVRVDWRHAPDPKANQGIWSALLGSLSRNE